ncbi:unnamed protein product, partial [Timema podura]|nr:unnamed protein product [Timema podura]
MTPLVTDHRRTSKLYWKCRKIREMGLQEDEWKHEEPERACKTQAQGCQGTRRTLRTSGDASGCSAETSLPPGIERK